MRHQNHITVEIDKDQFKAKLGLKDGKTPTKGELLELIKPLIPVVRDGRTPTQIELIDLIKPLIPKVKDGSPDTGEEIREKLKELKGKNRLPASAIHGLKELSETVDTMNQIGITGGRTVNYRDSAGSLISQYVTDLKFGTGISASYTNGQITLTVSSSGGGTPAGDTGDIQINTADEFDAETGKFFYTKATNKFNNFADYGSELAPALTASNWTTTSGWTVDTAPDVLNHGSNGVGVIQPSAATWVVAGTRYKITITMTVTAGSFSVSIGGNPDNTIATIGTNVINASGTYTFYITAVNTAKFLILPQPNTSRGKVTALSVVAMTDATGDTLIEGDIEVNNLKQNGALIRQRVQYNLLASVNNLNLGGNIGWLELLSTGAYSITGLVSNHGDGETIYIQNRLSQYIGFENQSTSSTDVNRFVTNTGTDLFLQGGDIAMAVYQGGNKNRWLLSKVSVASQILNNITTLDSYLSNFVISDEDMFIGVGNTNLKLHEASNISAIGDVDGNAEGSRILIDDTGAATYIEARVRGDFYIRDKTDDAIVFQIHQGANDFASRYTNINSKTLISDDLEGDPSTVSNSAVFEVRSNGYDYRGALPAPAMEQSNRDTIAGPINGLMIYNTTTNKYNFYDTGASAWQEITSTTAP